MSRNNGRDRPRQESKPDYTPRDIAVLDKNEYKQQRRLDRILDAHDAVAETNDDALWGLVSAELNQDGRNIVIQNTVKEFLRELLTPLREHAREVEGRDRYWFGRPDSPLGRVRFPKGDDVVFVGLRDYLYSAKFYTRSWEEQVTKRNKVPRVETREEQKTVPERASWNAFYLAKDFAAQERGLDLSVESDGLEEDDVAPDY